MTPGYEFRGAQLFVDVVEAMLTQSHTQMQISVESAKLPRDGTSARQLQDTVWPCGHLRDFSSLVMSSNETERCQLSRQFLVAHSRLVLLVVDVQLLCWPLIIVPHAVAEQCKAGPQRFANNGARWFLIQWQQELRVIARAAHGMERPLASASPLPPERV